VSQVHSVPPEIVLAQVRAVVQDIGVDAVKVGMLGAVEVTRAVARALDELPAGTPVVVDPVMVAESGARLLDESAHRVLIEEILPRATVLTPNLPEARVLAAGAAGRGTAGHETHELAREDLDAGDEAAELALVVLGLGPDVVVLTGGHRRAAVDLFLDAPDLERIVEIPGERYPDGAAHGSGCTHSSVLAAQLALGHTPLEAARTARVLAGLAVRNGLRDVGEGPGPVDVLGLADLRKRP
jgi:hydroxymethylpyrimidine/phosphomethylpyrimidine kinase